MRYGVQGNLAVSTSIHCREEYPTAADTTDDSLHGFVSDHMYSLVLAEKYNLFVENIVAYIAGFVVKKISKSIDCETCCEKLLSPDCSAKQCTLIKLKDRGGLAVPSDGVVAILLVAEKTIRRCMDVTSAMRMCNKNVVIYTLKRQFGVTDVLSLGPHILETQFGIDNHYFHLLKLLAEAYYVLRQRHVARLHNDRLKQNSVRQKLTKLILFKGD